MFNGFTLRHIACGDCGASVPKAELDAHECDPARLVERLTDEIREYAASPAGRFALWYAERDRRIRGA